MSGVWSPVNIAVRKIFGDNFREIRSGQPCRCNRPLAAALCAVRLGWHRCKHRGLHRSKRRCNDPNRGAIEPGAAKEGFAEWVV
jgi:hypothetical protein